ncbi:MAG: SCO family protein [Myxococcales bacterium]|nr:SCO family protein [Myxococcales bacterium]
MTYPTQLSSRISSVFALGLLCVALVGCNQPPAETSGKPTGAEPPVVAPAKPPTAPDKTAAAHPTEPAVAPAPIPRPPSPKPAAATALPDDSVYLVTSSWKNQHDKPQKLSALRGKVVVVSMVFTHCKYACPRLVSDMQKVEKKLSAAQKKDVRFLLVSMDPERDTPERLRTFAKEHHIAGWTLLTGPAGDVRVLNAVLGGRYKKAPSGDFAHSNLVIVLDRQGRIKHRQEGLDIAPTEALAAIAKLSPAGS